MEDVTGRHAAPVSRRRAWRVSGLGIGVFLLAVACFGGGLVWGMQAPGGSLGQAVASTLTPTPKAAKTPESPAPPEPDRAEPAGQANAVPGDSASPLTGLIAQAAAQAPVQPGLTISILGVGDILTHKEIIAQAIEDARGASPADFVPQLQGIADLVSSADMAVCHMEYPMGEPEGPWTAWPGIPDAPPQLAQAVADVGFDACSTASNHVLDQGFDGMSRLLDGLDAQGLAHAGAARTAEEASTPTIVDVKGVPIALLSYSYSLNGIPCPAGQEWCANLIDVPRMIDEARVARAAGARIVVLSLHAGDEGVSTPSSQQVEVMHALAESGQIDLVLGHHVHVVQPVDVIDGMWVVYGHGNLLTAQSRRDPRSGDGLISMFTFTEQSEGSFVVTDASGYAVHNDDFPFRLSLVPAIGSQTPDQAASWQRTLEAVNGLDAASKGFRLLPWSAPSL